MTATHLCIAALGILSMMGSAVATERRAPEGTTPQRAADGAPRPGCATEPATPPATPPARGEGSGTAPGGMGSTAWSGGMGGSHIGTDPSGGTPGSPQRQPATAEGVDPTRESGPGPC
jgi:hypothetical protein